MTDHLLQTQSFKIVRSKTGSKIILFNDAFCKSNAVATIPIDAFNQCRAIHESFNNFMFTSYKDQDICQLDEHGNMNGVIFENIVILNKCVAKPNFNNMDEDVKFWSEDGWVTANSHKSNGSNSIENICSKLVIGSMLL
eukprot:Pgem_evm1s19101